MDFHEHVISALEEFKEGRAEKASKLVSNMLAAHEDALENDPNVSSHEIDDLMERFYEDHKIRSVSIGLHDSPGTGQTVKISNPDILNSVLARLKLPKSHKISLPGRLDMTPTHFEDGTLHLKLPSNYEPLITSLQEHVGLLKFEKERPKQKPREPGHA